MSFAELGIDIRFRNKKEKEVGYVFKNNSNYKLNEGDVVVKVDSKYYRPTEVDLLVGDSTKARKELGWNPKYNLSSLIKEMVLSDLSIFKKNL